VDLTLLFSVPVMAPRSDPVVRRCLRSLAGSRCLVVDNTRRGEWRETCERLGLTWHGEGHNLGVATSWNLALDGGAHYTCLLSSSCAFRPGWEAMADAVQRLADPERGLLTDVAFHCQVWARPLVQRLGRFDERFWPAYYEDNDWVRRLHLAGLHVVGDDMMPKLMDLGLVRCWGDARTLKGGHVPGLAEAYARNRELYVEKWGGPPGEETLTCPRTTASAEPGGARR
jgi:hypothetical protein